MRNAPSCVDGVSYWRGKSVPLFEHSFEWHEGRRSSAQLSTRPVELILFRNGQRRINEPDGKQSNLSDRDVQKVRVYLFLCDHETESECLTRLLFGTTSANFEWAAKIVSGATSFLYNFESGEIWGPFEATSTADCYEKQAWRGKFPVQVRVAKNTNSRKSNLLISGRQEFLSGRKSRPNHYFDDPLATALLRWMVEEGEHFD
jgi:Development and cell death domain